MFGSLLQGYSRLYIAFREAFPNLYIVIISFLVTLWFQGMTRVIEKWFPNKTNVNVWLMIVPVLIMYFGDGRLEEIYNFENLQKRVAAMQHLTPKDQDN